MRKIEPIYKIEIRLRETTTDTIIVDEWTELVEVAYQHLNDIEQILHELADAPKVSLSDDYD